MRASLLVAVVCAAALTAAGCGDDVDPPTTSSTSTTVGPGTGDVVFGSGEIPDAFPDDIILPEGSVIGSTLVTPTRTEVAAVVMQGVEDVVAYFEASLSAAGYEIVDSSENQFNWTIDFTEPGILGNIVLNRQTEVITQYVVQVDKE